LFYYYHIFLLRFSFEWEEIVVQRAVCCNIEYPDMEWIEDVEQPLSTLSFLPIVQEDWNGGEYHHPLNTFTIYEIYHKAIYS
jgi:hypothetical protein